MHWLGTLMRLPWGLIRFAPSRRCPRPHCSLLPTGVQVRIHKFKAAINGPWDEAVPRLSRRVRAQLARPL